MSKTIEQALDAFICRFLQHCDAKKRLLQIEFDDDWPSDAIKQRLNDDQCLWQPVLQTQDNSLFQLEQGLQISVDKQLESYYCRYWSDNIDCQTERGGLQLLFVWNQDDFIRLQENLIAHVLMKRRLKQRDTLFFAVTDEDDWILSVLNDTGEVVLEQVGKEPQEVLAPDLASFLHMLAPL
ncbi:MAG: SecY-interacting protein [Aestuariibacter sp.]